MKSRKKKQELGYFCAAVIRLLFTSVMRFRFVDSFVEVPQRLELVISPSVHESDRRRAVFFSFSFDEHVT